MLRTKFQNHRPSGSGEDFLKFFAIYSHDGHLVLEEKILIFFLLFIAMAAIWSCDLDHLYKRFSLFLRMLNMKFGFDWPSGFRGDVSILWKYTCL